MKPVSVPHFSSTLFDLFLFFFSPGRHILSWERRIISRPRSCRRDIEMSAAEGRWEPSFPSLIGYPPFCSETTHEMSQKVTNLPHYLIIPGDVHLNRKVVDLIWKYVRNPFSPTVSAPDLAPRRLRHPRASGSAKCAVPHRITHTWFHPASFRGNLWLRPFNVLRNRDSVIGNSSR